ncbi:C2H2-type zinc finger transcription factor [Mucor lusitanicus]
MSDNNNRITRAAARGQQQAQGQQGEEAVQGQQQEEQQVQPPRVQQALGADAPDIGEPEITEEEVEDDDDFFPNLEADDEEEEEDNEEVIDVHFNEQEQDIIELTQADIVQSLTYQNVRNPNRLPYEFCSNPGTVLFYYFLGLYTGDGIHNAAGTLIGFGFKSTFFSYLDVLLRTCGVIAPRFYFSNYVDEVSQTYQGGNLGGVKWGYNDMFSARALFRYGLPSSNILDSIPNLVETLLPGTENRRILFFCFLLGYLCADGTVSWIWAGTPANCQARYQGIRLFARDQFIIQWFQREAEAYGCRSAIGLKRNAWRNVWVLYYATNDINNQSLLDGLTAMQEQNVPLDGKLLLLLNFLENNGFVQDRALPPKRVDFHTYLGASYDIDRGVDRTACVIGQDFFDLNRFELNDILRFIGFEELDNIYDFQLTRFVTQVREMMNQGNLTAGQQKFVQYYQNCQRRAIPNARIINKQYRTPFLFCGINGCQRYFTFRYRRLNHIQAIHDKIPFVCPVNGCMEEFKYASQVARHVSTDHGPQQVFRCDQCNRPLFQEEALNRHMIHFHNPNNRFRCAVPGCNKTYSTNIALQHHILHGHLREPGSIVCTQPGCAQTFYSNSNVLAHLRVVHHLEPTTFYLQDQMDAHMQTYHNPDNRFVCSWDNCGRRYIQIQTMRRHQERQHERLPCPQCNDEFVAPDQLQAHITKSHDPNKRYVCVFPGCNIRFTLRSSLERHQNKFGHTEGAGAAGAAGGPIRAVRGRVARAGRARGRGAAGRGTRGGGAAGRGTRGGGAAGRGTRGRGGA